MILSVNELTVSDCIDLALRLFWFVGTALRSWQLGMLISVRYLSMMRSSQFESGTYVTKMVVVRRICLLLDACILFSRCIIHRTYDCTNICRTEIQHENKSIYDNNKYPHGKSRSNVYVGCTTTCKSRPHENYVSPSFSVEFIHNLNCGNNLNRLRAAQNDLVNGRLVDAVLVIFG